MTQIIGPVLPGLPRFGDRAGSLPRGRAEQAKHVEPDQHGRPLVPGYAKRQREQA
ncbi:MAG: hypothetical protein ACRDRL_09590 [Sciscionella sp.]